LTPAAILIGLVVIVVAWVAKQILAALIGQQVKGSIPDYASHRARAAAQRLPAEMREAYAAEWLAELATLDAKPLTAIRYAAGLSRAASDIARASGLQSPAGRLAVASRARDVVGSAMLLFLLAPLFSAIALGALLLNRGRPVLSRSLEPGKDGQPFIRLRFTTIKRTPDGRFAHTRLGGFLSQSSLSELPVLINVLRGDLSFIGPPSGYKAFDGEELFRLKVRPGLLSWQLLVAEGLVRISMEEARYRDEHRNLKNDLALILHSTKAVVWPNA
jgi:lipopolysaccharide/colanic/teichoic acid biosynthesis glycosyltransferase